VQTRRVTGGTPPISVILPVRNGGRFLAPALESVLAQTGVPFDVLVVEDASSDQTPAVLAAFAARHANLRVLRGEGRGIARALNLAVAHAAGRYIARMDADDITLPGRLAAQFQYLEQHPQVGVLGTQAWRIDEQDRRLRRVRVPVGTRRVRAALEVSAPLVHPTVMLRRDLVLAVGGYRPLFDTAEDYDLWLRLADLTEIDNLKEVFLLYRSHPNQQTLRRGFRQARLSALALITRRLRQATGRDPLEGADTSSGWRLALGGTLPGVLVQVHQLTASALADNGGSLSPSGARYLRCACRAAATVGSREIKQRLALACVRHQLQLMRANRWREAFGSLRTDLIYWRGALLQAYVRQAGILWRAAVTF
jgi:hypothetical protein